MIKITDADKHIVFVLDEEARVIEHRKRRNGWEYVTRLRCDPDGTFTREATKEPVENSFLVDLEKEGYKAKCADCGADMMLCDACRHLPDGTYLDNCDFRWIDQERGIGTCFRREGGTET